MRWLLEAWNGAHAARAAGADVVAVTPWALLGSYDWDSLVTEARGHYESGAFDVRARRAASDRGGGGHRAAGARRTSRAIPASSAPGGGGGRSGCSNPPARRMRQRRRGVAPAAADSRRHRHARPGVPARWPTGAACPPSAPAGATSTSPTSTSVRPAASRRVQPWAVINAAGYVRVDDAERDSDACFDVNTTGAGERRRRPAGGRRAARHLLLGPGLRRERTTSPYTEADSPRPLNVYGASKAEGRAPRARRHAGGAGGAHQRVLRAVGRGQLRGPDARRHPARRTVARRRRCRRLADLRARPGQRHAGSADRPGARHLAPDQRRRRCRGSSSREPRRGACGAPVDLVEPARRRSSAGRRPGRLTARWRASAAASCARRRPRWRRSPAASTPASRPPAADVAGRPIDAGHDRCSRSVSPRPTAGRSCSTPVTRRPTDTAPRRRQARRRGRTRTCAGIRCVASGSPTPAIASTARSCRRPNTTRWRRAAMPAHPTEVPDGRWDIAVFENMFPTFTAAVARSADALRAHDRRPRRVRGCGVHAGRREPAWRACRCGTSS